MKRQEYTYGQPRRISSVGLTPNIDRKLQWLCNELDASQTLIIATAIEEMYDRYKQNQVVLPKDLFAGLVDKVEQLRLFNGVNQ